MTELLGTRGIVASVAVVAFLLGASLTLFSQDSGPSGETTVGAKLVDEFKALEETHLSQMRSLRHELRQVLKGVRRAKNDAAYAAEAEAAPGKLSALLNKVLDAENGFQRKHDELVIGRRDALVAEVTGQMIQGNRAHPGLIPHLLPTVQSLTNELKDWNELFSIVRSSARFDEDGDEDEGFD